MDEQLLHKLLKSEVLEFCQCYKCETNFAFTRMGLHAALDCYNCPACGHRDDSIFFMSPTAWEDSVWEEALVNRRLEIRLRTGEEPEEWELQNPLGKEPDLRLYTCSDCSCSFYCAVEKPVCPMCKSAELSERATSNEKVEEYLMETTEHTIRQVMKRTAMQLADSMVKTGWLGHWKNPMPERNTVVHIASALQTDGFGVWAEPLHHKGGEEHIDLAAISGSSVLAFEVKTFGNWNWNGVESDIQRLRSYKPNVAPRICDASWDSRLDTSEDSWGIIVIQFFGNGFHTVWESLSPCCGEEGDRVANAIKSYLQLPKNERKDKNMKQSAFESVVGKLRELDSIYGAEPVIDCEFKKTGKLSLFWAAFKIDTRRKK